MTSTIPNIVPSGNDEITSDRFLSVQFTILKTNLTLAEKVAYALILSWRDRECFYSHQSFAELLSCSERKAQDVLKSLAKKGLIEVTARNGTSNAYRALPWQNLLPPLTDTLAESATPPSRICHPPQQNLLPPLAESATYNNNYKINDKISCNNAVADAPATTIPHRFLASELSTEERSKLLALLEGPARLANQDPTKVLEKILLDCERWSNSGTDKKKLRVSWFETLKRQFVKRAIEDMTRKPSKPTNPLVLNYPQAKLVFQDLWNEAHGLDRPDVSFVTKAQAEGIFKTIRRWAVDEIEYLSLLKHKRPEQAENVFIDFWTAYKEINLETNQ